MNSEDLSKFLSNPAWLAIQDKCRREAEQRMEQLLTPSNSIEDALKHERIKGWIEALRWNPLIELIEEKRATERSQ